MATYILSNARIVTPHENFIGSVIINNGLITGVEKGAYYSEGIDVGGKWLIPGCIDIHTDYLEKELYPRPNAAFPLPFALHYLDARAISCGITTVFSAISFSDNEAKNRSFPEAIAVAKQIDAIRHSLLARHYLHGRVDPNTDTILEYLDAMSQLESLYMVVYNDHVPGVRQFTIEQQVEMRVKHLNISAEEAREMLRTQSEKLSQINNRLVIQEAFKDRCIIGSHDDTTIEHVIEGKNFGATLSEMPTTLEAARKAKELGQWVCLGAPNYYRGGSHCGNLSSHDAMEEDIVDIFCSDYHFPTMLASVIKMMENGVDVSKAVNTVTLNPAKLLNFDKEIGSIEVGKKADIVVFDQQELLASVNMVFVDGILKYKADYETLIKPLAAEISQTVYTTN
jgi:alpha-D-ribose 1-methylphosphonate 5-triphosphate diphosphatase